MDGVLEKRQVGGCMATIPLNTQGMGHGYMQPPWLATFIHEYKTKDPSH